MAKQKLPISGYDYVMPKPDAETIRKSIVYKLIFILGVDPKEATSHQWLNAAMLAARDLIAEDFLKTRRAHIDNSKRMVYYLSMEFLLGRSFVNALINEGVYAEFEEAFKQLGKEFADVCEQEEDPGLGNGGLGRLAACFLDSLATLRIPAMGYGIVTNTVCSNKKSWMANKLKNPICGSTKIWHGSLPVRTNNIPSVSAAKY